MKKTTIKKIAALLLALVVMIPAGMIGVFADDAATTPTGPVYTATVDWGDPDGDGVFEIATPGDLLAFSANRAKYGNYKDKTVILTADIDMNPGWDASSGTAPTNAWAPLGYLTGVLDGQGYTIKGLYCFKTAADPNNASFLGVAGGSNGASSTIKNLKIENSYFHAERCGAGLVGYVQGGLVVENVIVDAICKAEDGYAAGFGGYFRATGATHAPSVTLTNCVFMGSVTASRKAGAFVASNNRDDSNMDGDTSKGDKGIGTYSVTMTDCVNYGTVVCADKDGKPTNGSAAGLIGDCANEATLIRCYNANGAGTALVNVTLSESKNLDEKPVTVTLEDCYYLAGEGVVGMTKAGIATATVTLKYDGATATEAKTATVTELLAKNAFKASDTSKGWTTIDEGKIAVPQSIVCLNTGHDYSSVVTAPTCSTQGFTTFTCKKCNYAYEGNIVETSDHTAGDWIVDREATEEFAGMKHKECTVCQAVMENAVIPKLPATETTAPDNDETTAPAGDETTAPADNETDATASDKTSSCKSSIALGSALGMASIIGLGAIALGKKRR